MQDRRNAGYTVLVRGHNRRHDENVRDLADLRGLNINNGCTQPASVTGVVIRAEGDQQKQQENIKCDQQIPVLRHDFHIDGRDNGKSDKAHDRRTDLNGDITEVTAELVCGCSTCDDNTAKRRCDEAQKKQDPVTLLGKDFQNEV